MSYPSKAANNGSYTLFEDDMPWSIADLVDRYYYSYLEYPNNVNDLIDFAWNTIQFYAVEVLLTDSMDNYSRRGEQYEDFMLYSDTFYKRLNYLEMNRENISVKIDNNVFYLNNHIDELFVVYEADICYDIQNPLSKLFRDSRRIFLYDESGKEIISFDSSILSEQLRKIWNDFYVEDGLVEYRLLKYERIAEKVISLCPVNEIPKDYLEKIYLLLKDFISKNSQVYSMVVVMPISR